MAKAKGHLVQYNDEVDDVAIRVENVSKSFKLPHNKQSSLKGALINLIGRGDRTYETQEVLKNISFEIKKGEFFGIVGRNGSGKSTLLKMLAGIYTPTSGKIMVNGTLTPFIELGVGFSPELTGRENIYLNGALLGFNEKEVDEMYEDIVSFAELERFVDQKFKNYSSGLQVRLAFSIAIKVNTGILVLDEVLAVGDAAFQQKCFDYFMNLKHQKKTVVLVTHDMGAVRQYCDRAILIESGAVSDRGTPEKIAAAYQKLFIETHESSSFNEAERWGSGDVRVEKASTRVDGQKVQITTKYKVRESVEKPIFGLSIYSPGDIGLVDMNTYQLNKQTGDLNTGDLVEIVWEVPNIFTKGKYRVSVGCTNASFHKTYDQVPAATDFRITNETPTGGLIFPATKLQSYKVTRRKGAKSVK